MSRSPPYTLDILRLAASLPVDSSLPGFTHSADARSATCGSVIRTFLSVSDGRIHSIAQKVTACAYGQASAALVQGWAPGRLRAEVIVMRAALKAWLDGRGEVPAEFAVLAPVRAGGAPRRGAAAVRRTAQGTRSAGHCRDRRRRGRGMIDYLTWLTILLVAALLFVGIFRRLGLGATLGYIVGGIVVGPSVLNVSGNAEAINQVSEIGIALLLFIVGLELQPSRLWRLKREIFGLGLAQLLAAGAVLTVLVKLALGIGWGPAAAIGLALGLSSTAQVLPMLRSTGELNSPHGERAFSILLLQDLALIPLITLIAALNVGGDPDAPSGLEMTGLTVGAVIGLVLAGRYVVAPLFGLIGRLGERELFIVAGLTTVVGAAAMMHALHLSVALGAFVAGVMLAESPYRHELESDIEPFRSILLGLFFMSVGMLLDLRVIASEPLMVIGLAIAVIILKAAVLYPIARVFGAPPGRSATLALLLSQAGEFGFVLFASAAAGRLITTEQASSWAP